MMMSETLDDMQFDKVSTPVDWRIEIEPRREIQLPANHPFASVGENGWRFDGEDNCKYVLWRNVFYYIGTQYPRHGDLDAFEAYIRARQPEFDNLVADDIASEAERKFIDDLSNTYVAPENWTLRRWVQAAQELRDARGRGGNLK